MLYLRGISVCGAEFGTPDPPSKKSRFSNRKPGVYDTAYHYESRETFDYLAGRGMDLVRLAFRLERLQRTLGGELDATELSRLRDTGARARAAGLQVLLDLHNYGDYYLHAGKRGIRRPVSSAQVTRAHFADVWRRISAAFKADPGVIGYGLMAEPVAMPSSAQGWELASQQALDAIRGNGDEKLVAVSGYEWAGVQHWPDQHPDKWIVDNADNHMYEGHHYWDRDNSGGYAYAYAQEVANAGARGF
ncbi:MAG: cellulase family glycosylhydrolase [Rubrobacter sp.]|nr:cellulase family glycosylhydrolase [Rubrobacter sp.]